MRRIIISMTLILALALGCFGLAETTEPMEQPATEEQTEQADLIMNSVKERMEAKQRKQCDCQQCGSQSSRMPGMQGARCPRCLVSRAVSSRCRKCLICKVVSGRCPVCLAAIIGNEN